MATLTLSSGSLSTLRKDPEAILPDGLVLKVTNLEAIAGNKHKCTFTDGPATMRGILTSQFASDIASGNIRNGSKVKLISYACNRISSDNVLMATELEVLETGDGMEVDKEVLTARNTEPLHSTPPASAKPDVMQPRTSGLKENSTPGPMLSPSDESKFRFPKTPANTPGGMQLTPSRTAPTPPSTGPPGDRPNGTLDRRSYHKIGQVHPYESNWCIKAQVARKYPLRAANIKGSETKILAVELVDDSGQPISATFWRVMAERMDATLTEGRVYVFHRFKVSPADKKFASVKHDYKIDFNDTTEVAESADQDTTAMTTSVDLVPIDQLPKYLTRSKLPVDVCGVVTAVGQQASIKRKSDNTEVDKRDVTLADRSGKSVVLTVWGANAAVVGQLEGQEGQVVLQATSCRVSDYNGCSINSMSKSTITINPEGPATQELIEWYAAAVEQGEKFAAVGQDLPGTRGGSAGGGGGAGGRDAAKIGCLRDLASIAPEQCVDDKPVWTNCLATLALINADSNLFYLANPENGKKVVDQGGGQLWCEGDQKFVERAEHRYMMYLRVADHTGEASVNIFNREAEAMMGFKADDLAAAKAEDPSKYESMVKGAQWRSWSVSIASKEREYNGERRMRHSVMVAKPIDWVAEGRRLLEIIGRY